MELVAAAGYECRVEAQRNGCRQVIIHVSAGALQGCAGVYALSADAKTPVARYEAAIPTDGDRRVQQVYVNQLAGVSIDPGVCTPCATGIDAIFDPQAIVSRIVVEPNT